MDSIGTITQYFPFIDQETKSVLENVMSEALDYYDFVQKLCDLVLSNDSPVMVVYFAIHHCILAREYGLVDRIREQYGHHQILGPNLFYSSVCQGNYKDAKKAQELAVSVIETNPDDWIHLEMNLIQFELDMWDYPNTMYKSSTMDRIRELIDSNSNFGFYEIVLCDFLESRAQVDGDTKERLRCFDRGIQFANEFDDRLRKAHLLIRKGSFLMNFDRSQSKTSLQEAYQIVESSIGIPFNYSFIIYYLSLLDAIRGEFDKAISGCLKAVSVLERAGLESGNPASFLSIFHNVIGEPESGLEWGRMAEDQFKSRPYLINHAMLFQIWSLILMKRIPEASALIDTSRESILKSGNEDQLAWFHFVSGLLELEDGNSSLALSSIEQGLKIYEQQGTALLMENIFLHQLAKIEILSSASDEIVSPSLAILEERAMTENLPGILGQVLLLKADIALLRKDEALLREIVPQLRSLIDSKDLKFLKPYFDNLENRL